MLNYLNNVAKYKEINKNDVKKKKVVFEN